MTAPLVGRGEQRSDVRRRLRDARMITLTGIGGVGKTRLAVSIADDVATVFPDGVWWTDLSSLTEPALLARTVAAALGVRDQSQRDTLDSLVAHLSDYRLLLVLDNCEHLAEAVAELAGTLLRAVPTLRVLATSRHWLGVPGEQVLEVPPLTVSAGAAGDSEAVRLLVDRAQAHQAIVDDVVGALRLCQVLEGIPLAIVLVAAQLRTTTVGGVLAQLGHDQFRLLANDGTVSVPSHQQTLRGVVEWSYELCSHAEQLMWQRLTVFSGGFDLAAIEAVCCYDGIDPGDALDLVAGLVRQSVLTAHSESGRTRYRMLETLRQYGRERLAGAGEDQRAARRHAEYYLTMTERAMVDWFGPREVTWLEGLGQDLPNLRAAMEFSLAGGDLDHIGLRTAVALASARSWFYFGTLGEGRWWLQNMLSLPHGDHVDTAVRGLAFAAWHSLCEGDHALARQLLDRAGDLDGGPAVTALVSFVEGVYALFGLRSPDSVGILVDARDRLRALGCAGEAHQAGLYVAVSNAFMGDRDTAVAVSKAHLAEAEERGAVYAAAWGQWARGLVELRQGDPHEAIPILQESLRRWGRIGDRWGSIWAVEMLALSAVRLGRYAYAAQLLGATTRMQASTGVAISGLGPFAVAHTQAVERVRVELGDRRYAELTAAGAALSFEATTRLALEEIDDAGSGPTLARPPEPLSARELEVAELIARGKSNREIAARLVISQHTCDTHVRSILRKLGRTSRTEIAGWYLRRPAT